MADAYEIELLRIEFGEGMPTLDLEEGLAFTIMRGRTATGEFGVVRADEDKGVVVKVSCLVDDEESAVLALRAEFHRFTRALAEQTKSWADPAA